jgi:L-lactate permease
VFPIAWIVFSSIMLYRLAVHTGKFEIIKFGRLHPELAEQRRDRLLSGRDRVGTVAPRQPASLCCMYKDTFRQLATPMLTIASMLPLAYLMNYSGMTSTLGIALAATGSTFPFFSAILGWLGVFLTGSDTSANALFGNLQMITANQIGLNPVLTASVNSAAGVMGKMIALPSIAVAVAATGLTPEDEGKLFRFTLTHSIFLARVVGIVAMLFGYVFPSMVPVLP